MDEFLENIERYRNEFYRFILRNVWDSGVADDVFQQAVLAAYENRAKYTPGTNFRAWMYRILLNKCYVANRETGRTFDRLDDQAESALEAEPAAEYANLLSDQDGVLERCGDEVFMAFRSLSTAQRTALLLRGIEKFSYQEIADVMDIPVGTVMTHLARGRKKLRTELTEYAVRMGVIRRRPRLLQTKQDRSLGKESEAEKR